MTSSSSSVELLRREINHAEEELARLRALKGQRDQLMSALRDLKRVVLHCGDDDRATSDNHELRDTVFKALTAVNTHTVMNTEDVASELQPRSNREMATTTPLNDALANKEEVEAHLELERYRAEKKKKRNAKRRQREKLKKMMSKRSEPQPDNHAEPSSSAVEVVAEEKKTPSLGENTAREALFTALDTFAATIAVTPCGKDSSTIDDEPAWLKEDAATVLSMTRNAVTITEITAIHRHQVGPSTDDDTAPEYSDDFEE